MLYPPGATGAISFHDPLEGTEIQQAKQNWNARGLRPGPPFSLTPPPEAVQEKGDLPGRSQIQRTSQLHMTYEWRNQ